MSHESDSVYEIVESVFNFTEPTNSSSGEEVSMSEWTSLEQIHVQQSENKKKTLQKQGYYSPGSSNSCGAYSSMTDSTIFRHPYYNYPAVLDPGIKLALLGPEESLLFTSDGQDQYLHLCSEMNLCPVRMFHKNLLDSEINLSYYGVNPRGVRAMAIALQYNKLVTRFDLTDNFLNDDACYHLGQMLRSNLRLQELILAGCRIGASGLMRLGENLYFNRTLVELDLARNNIGDDGGVIFANLVSNGASIKKVNLSYNGLDRETALAIIECFEFRNPLTHLDLSWNNFNHTPSTAKMLERLASSQILQKLNLSFNNLEGERLASAIYKVLNLPELTVLDLSHNRFKGEAINIIAGGLINAKKLIILNLSHNPMSPGDAYFALEKMLRPRVRLQNLQMEGVSVNKHFLTLLDRVTNMKDRQNFTVTYGDVLKNWTVSGPDARALLLKRADYLCNLNKRLHLDLPVYFLSLNKEINKPVPIKNMLQRFQNDKVPLSEDFINELSSAYPGPKIGKIRTINLKAICEYMERLWPDKKLPPTPPPEPEAKWEPEALPSPKIGKDKEKK